nr:immunoglobulin light chain junction region [Macaca mulatta]
DYYCSSYAGTYTFYVF